jgi:hypothetical protein
MVVAEKLMAYGKKAQAHAATFAVRKSRVLRAMKKIGTDVTAEKKVLMARKTSAAALAYRPKEAKMPANRYG